MWHDVIKIELTRTRLRCGGLLEVRDELLPLCRLLDAREHHLGALDVLLGCEQVVEQGALLPEHARGLVGGGVGVVLHAPRHPPEQAVQVGALLVAGSLLRRSAMQRLSETGCEKRGCQGGVRADRRTKIESGRCDSGLQRMRAFVYVVDSWRAALSFLLLLFLRKSCVCVTLVALCPCLLMVLQLVSQHGAARDNAP